MGIPQIIESTSHMSDMGTNILFYYNDVSLSIQSLIIVITGVVTLKEEGSQLGKYVLLRRLKLKVPNLI